MYADATQENGPSVKQNFCASCFNAAEADLVLHVIGFRFNCHLVELGVFGGPQLQVGVKVDRR